MTNTDINILIAGINWPPETFLSRLFDGLADKGIKIWVASNEKPAEEWKKRDNCFHIWAPSWRIPFISRCLNLLFLSKNLIGLRKERYKALFTVIRNISNLKLKIYTLYKILPFVKHEKDIVYFPWVFLAYPFIDWFKLTEQSFVVSLRGSMVNVYPFSGKDASDLSLQLTSVLKVAAAVHCVSQDIQQEAVQFGLDIEKSRVIRPAVDPAFFTPAAKSPNNNRIKLVTTGSLIWRKGYEYLLLGLKKLLEIGIDVEMHIIGEGCEYNRVLYTSYDLGLKEHVILHGKLSPREVRGYLQISDIFVLSSLSEGISNAVLEAMSCGLPVVTTDCGGMREAVTDEIEGFVVPVRDPEAMALALKKLAEDPVLREKMGISGRQRVLKEFNLNDQVKEFINIFNLVKSTNNSLDKFSNNA